MLRSYNWDGWVGLVWKSLCGAIFRASLCDAYKKKVSITNAKKKEREASIIEV